MIEVADVAVRIDDVVLLPATALTVAAGELCAVRGPNGSGKSTLLQVVSGQLHPSQGSVLVDGRMPDSRRRGFRETVAAALHPPVVARDLTLREHLVLVAKSWGTHDADAVADAELNRWGLETLRQRFPHELSSGQRQLFALALAWARPARVLILDEPEQRLDTERRARLVSNILERCTHGQAVLVATHSDEVSDVADQVVMLA